MENNYKEISEKLSVNINDSGKNVLSFKARNNLPLRNNFLLHSPERIINVKTNFYEAVSEKFGIHAASKKHSFPPPPTPIQYYYFGSLIKGNKLSQHLYRKLKNTSNILGTYLISILLACV